MNLKKHIQNSICDLFTNTSKLKRVVQKIYLCLNTGNYKTTNQKYKLIMGFLVGLSDIYDDREKMKQSALKIIQFIKTGDEKMNKELYDSIQAEIDSDLEFEHCLKHLSKKEMLERYDTLTSEEYDELKEMGINE